nr:histidine phosphatase family protein [uncultured Peptostreptococcus sp.]
MNTYYLVRHGQTIWNTQGRTQGHGNSPLTDLGLAQAKNLAKYLKEYPIDMIYCSDLGRAVETAEIIANELGLDLKPTPALREMGFGEWEGMPIPKIKEKYPDLLYLWRNEPDKADIPGGETLHIVKEREDRLIDELNEKYQNKHILLISHSVTVRVMLLSFLDAPLSNLYRIKQDNTALNIVEFREYGPVVMKMNDITHLNSGEFLDLNQIQSPLE